LVVALSFCLAALPGCSQNQCPHQGDMKCQGAQALWCQPNDSETIAGTYLDWLPYLPRPCPECRPSKRDPAMTPGTHIVR